MGESALLALLKRGKGTSEPARHGDEPLYQWPDPAKPSAVLVPPMVRAHRTQVRTRKSVMGLVAATVSVAALACGGSLWAAGGAHTDREAAEAQLADAKAQVVKYQPYAFYAGQLHERQEALTLQLGDDIAFSTLTDTVIDARPAGLHLSGLEAQPGQPCSSPDPFAPAAALGCLKVSGTAGSTEDVAAFVDDLNGLPTDSGLTGAFASSLSSRGEGFDFTVSVNYTAEVLSYRYVPEPTANETAPATAEEGVDQ